MRKYICDRCGKKVRESGDLSYINNKTGEIIISFMSPPRKERSDFKDICKTCLDEYDTLRKKILSENKQRFVDWFQKKK